MSSELIAGSYTIKRIEFLVYSPEVDVCSAANELADYFSFKAEIINTLDDLQVDTQAKSSPLVVLVSLLGVQDTNEKIKLIKNVRGLYARAQIVVAIRDNESTAERDSLTVAGAQRLIQHHEIKNTSKFYYLISLLINGSYLPIGLGDLFPSTQVDFNAYHKLPLNQNYLPVIFSGFIFSDKKYRRLESVKQVYVRREDLHLYRQYIEKFHDNRGNALKKRCRTTLLSLMGIYTEVMLLVNLDSEVNKPENLKIQMDLFEQTAMALGEYLKDCPDVWNVIAQSLDFQFCRYERGPYILGYALYIALKAGLPNLKDIVMGVLLADIGLLGMPVSVFQHLQKKGIRELTGEMLEKYRGHSMASLNLAMAHEIEMPDSLKSVIVCTHERADGKGFPNQSPKDQLPLEAQLIQFCEILDRRVRVSLEDETLTHDFVRKQVWEEEKQSLSCFNADFLDKIQSALLTPVA